LKKLDAKDLYVTKKTEWTKRVIAYHVIFTNMVIGILRREMMKVKYVLKKLAMTNKRWIHQVFVKIAPLVIKPR